MSIDRAHALEPDHPHLAEGAAEIDPIADWCDKYRRAKEGEKVCKETAEEARAVIAAYLDEREATVGTVNSVPVIRWQQVNSQRIKTALLREKYPEIADEVTGSSTSWRMEIL